VKSEKLKITTPKLKFVHTRAIHFW
jgi:hypothetical protein